jgi:hypothetical protein
MFPFFSSKQKVLLDCLSTWENSWLFLTTSFIGFQLCDFDRVLCLSFLWVTITNCKLSRICVVEFWVHEEILSIRGALWLQPIPNAWPQKTTIYNYFSRIFPQFAYHFKNLKLLALTKCRLFSCINLQVLGTFFCVFPATFSDFLKVSVNHEAQEEAWT